MLYTMVLSSTDQFSVIPSFSLFTLAFCVSCSSWLLRSGAGHLVLSHPRCPRGATIPSGSRGAIGRASIQLCSGFGVWHGPVPGEQKDESFLFLLYVISWIIEILKLVTGLENKIGYHWLQVIQLCVQSDSSTKDCHVIVSFLTRPNVWQFSALN